MYTGTLINDLMAAVDLAQQQAQVRVEEEKEEFHFAPALYQVTRQEAALLGAA